LAAMTIELLVTGQELVRGVTVDTNSPMLAQWLEHKGVSIRRISVVGDDLEQIISALSDALSRADIVIVTGGLGPTADDQTRHAAAKVFDAPLNTDLDSLMRLQNIFSSMGRKMPPNNVIQAQFPRGSQIIENPVGTARGFMCGLNGKKAYFLPGVPSELKAMATSVVSEIAAVAVEGAIVSSTLKTIGIPESELDRLLTGFPPEGSGLMLGFSAKLPEIHLYLSARGQSIEQAQTILQDAETHLGEILGAAIYGRNDDTLQAIMGRELKKRNLKMAVAESCTAGLLAGKITEVPGSSQWFLEGIAAYSDEAKMRLLAVPRQLLEEFGAVSEECAAAMAQGAMEAADADIAVSITGIAGPDGGTPEKPVGTVCFGFACRNFVRAFTRRFIGDRSGIRDRSVAAALNVVRLHLLFEGGTKNR